MALFGKHWGWSTKRKDGTSSITKSNISLLNTFWDAQRPSSEDLSLMFLLTHVRLPGLPGQYEMTVVNPLENTKHELTINELSYYCFCLCFHVIKALLGRNTIFFLFFKHIIVHILALCLRDVIIERCSTSEHHQLKSQLKVFRLLTQHSN